MSKNKIVAFVICISCFIAGALCQRYYDTQGQRRVARVISQISASAQNATPVSTKKDLVVSKNTATEHYTADVCLVWCFDNRFAALRDEFIKTRGYKRVDPVYVAGGGKDILSNDGYIIDQIRKSCALHHTKEVVLMVHTGCGAYGGKENPSFYAEELSLIKRVTTELLKDVEHPPKVTTVLAQYDGLYETH